MLEIEPNNLSPADIILSRSAGGGSVGWVVSGEGGGERKGGGNGHGGGGMEKGSVKWDLRGEGSGCRGGGGEDDGGRGGNVFSSWPTLDGDEGEGVSGDKGEGVVATAGERIFDQTLRVAKEFGERGIEEDQDVYGCEVYENT